MRPAAQTMGALLNALLPFAAGTLVVMLAVAWPVGLRYRSQRESGNATRSGPPAIG